MAFGTGKAFSYLDINAICHALGQSKSYGNKSMEIQGALLQHSKRAAYQAGIWCTSELSNQERPSPEGWGWSWDDKIRSWTPVWTTIPIARKACAELIKYGCKSKNGCGARCGCRKANWMCTELCSCK